MKLAVSNIAWPQELDADVASLLFRSDVRGIEVAPTKVHPRPLEATPDDLLRYREFWESRGIEIVAMQALLFGAPPFRVFGSDTDRRDLLDYLTGIYRMAAGLGATALVFGSPKNRQRGDLSLDQARDIAIPFFREAGLRAADVGVWLCLEHNPAAYACDFITTSTQARDLVLAVDTPGFGLHLDTGGLIVENEPCEVLLDPAAKPWWRHFHVSDPHLAPLGQEPGRHPEFGQAIRASGYDGWVSLEMKTLPVGRELELLCEAVRFAKQSYFASIGQAVPDTTPGTSSGTA
jgi:D-psicose/D-tagatose/L-ribulose 3-epimerase